MLIKKHYRLLLVLLGFIFYLLIALIRLDIITSKSYRSQGRSIHVQFVKKIYNSGFHYLGDRNRMPLYYYIQALFNGKHDEDNLAYYGKVLNIDLSLIVIILLYLVTFNYLSKFSSVVFTIIIAYVLFLPRSTYIQPEILYYYLNFITFLYFNKTIKGNKIRDASTLGIFAALSYLTKATILIGFLLFISFQTINFIINSITHLHSTKKILISTLLSIFIFLSILCPYLLENKKIYNRYFYNYSTNTAFWYKSYSDLLSAEKSSENSDQQSLRGSGDKNSTFIAYFKRNSIKKALVRGISGAVLIIIVLIKSNASIPFSILLLYFLAFIYIILYDKTGTKLMISFVKKNGRIVIFSFCYFLIYLIAFAWYAPIDPGSRFIYSIYIPLLFTIFLLIEKYNKSTSGKKTSVLIHLLVLLFTVIIFVPITLPSILNESFSS